MFFFIRNFFRFDLFVCKFCVVQENSSVLSDIYFAAIMPPPVFD